MLLCRKVTVRDESQQIVLLFHVNIKIKTRKLSGEGQLVGPPQQAKAPSPKEETAWEMRAVIWAVIMMNGVHWKSRPELGCLKGWPGS